MGERHLTLVLPAFNEAHKILADLKRWEDFLSVQPFQSEILVVDDGSRDDTLLRLEDWQAAPRASNLTFHFESYRPNRGKGFALKTGALHATGKWLAFVDVGGCIEPEALTRALSLLEKGNDVVLASRRHKDSQWAKKAQLHRQLGSRAFRFLIAKIFGVPFSDTQCGFKAYRGEVGRRLFQNLHTDGFMFDLEILLRARKEGLRIVEFPVRWKTDGDTRYHLVSGTLMNAKELFRIWKNIQAE